MVIDILVPECALQIFFLLTSKAFQTCLDKKKKDKLILSSGLLAYEAYFGVVFLLLLATFSLLGVLE